MLSKTSIYSPESFLTRKTLHATVSVTVDISFFVYVNLRLHRLQPGKDKQNVTFAPPWKNFCGCPCLQRVDVGGLFIL